jgi:Protein of unknown function (DUF3102)
LNLPNLAKNSSFESSHQQMLNITEQYNFNYEILDRQTQISVKQRTFEIKCLIRQTAKDIVNVGQKLSEVKQQLKHGEFRNWLKTEFNWSISSATKFMQVSEQFKNVNFTHFNFAASALYILAAPSTPESARKYALQLATEGENITYSLAKLVVKHHKELAKTDTYLPNQLNSSNITQLDTQALDTQEILSEVDVIQKNVAENFEKSVRIIAIKQESPKYIEDRIQDFEIIYAGNCIAVEGSPKNLTILFRKMQDNPQFAEDIFRQAELLSE